MLLKAFDDLQSGLAVTVVFDEAKIVRNSKAPLRFSHVEFFAIVRTLRDQGEGPTGVGLSVLNVRRGLAAGLLDRIIGKNVKRQVLGPVAHNPQSVARECSYIGQ